uniref:Uncharacterized protein n=1 Tax=Arundo donax TaxID=35708 RepID=A0A0A8YR43_ARUDO
MTRGSDSTCQQQYAHAGPIWHDEGHGGATKLELSSGVRGGSGL